MEKIRQDLIKKILEKKEKSVKRMKTNRYNNNDRYLNYDTGELFEYWPAFFSELLVAELVAKDETVKNLYVPIQCMDLETQKKKDILQLKGYDLAQWPEYTKLPIRETVGSSGFKVKYYDPLDISKFSGIDVKTQLSAHNYGSINVEWETWNKANQQWDTNKGSTIHTRLVDRYAYLTRDKIYIVNKKDIIEKVKELGLKPFENTHTDRPIRSIKFPLDLLSKISIRIYDIPEEDKEYFDEYKNK